MDPGTKIMGTAALEMEEMAVLVIVETVDPATPIMEAIMDRITVVEMGIMVMETILMV